MAFKSALLFGYFLSALLALATPLSGDLAVQLRRKLDQLEHNVHLARQDHPSSLIARAETNPYWAGASIRKDNGQVAFVGGDILVPWTGYDKFWYQAQGIFVVGIDVLSGCGPYFLAGVAFYVGLKIPSNWAFFLWDSTTVPNENLFPFPVQKGDRIRVRITAHNATFVTFSLMLMDPTTRFAFFTRDYEVAPEYGLCMRDAFWGVAVLNNAIFPDFDPLEIKVPYAEGPNGEPHLWSDATAVNLVNFDAKNDYNVTTEINVGSSRYGDSATMTRNYREKN